MKPKDVHIEFIGGMMPNQAYGTVFGKRFYFRARHGRWELRIGDTDKDSVTGEVIADGTDRYAGGWDKDELLEHLKSALNSAARSGKLVAENAGLFMHRRT